MSFKTLEHVDPNICGLEATQLIVIHLNYLGEKFSGWDIFRKHVLEISKLTAAGKDDRHHIGVIMSAIRTLEDRKNRTSEGISENDALDALRGAAFTSQLEGCFYFEHSQVTPDMKKYLQMTLVSRPGNGVEDFSRSPIGPLLRAGIINTDGKFSCLAANWYYNRNCFPGRPLDGPGSLRELIFKAIGSVSAKRLREAVKSGLPKDAAFKQLMNEAMSAHMPVRHSITPEFNTKAVESQDSSAKAVTGELDFYAGGDKQWCVEILRERKDVGKHSQGFEETHDSHGNNGKYREVLKKEYYIIDCRGPKKGNGVKLEDHNCALYFERSFSKCVCEIKGINAEEIQLMM